MCTDRELNVPPESPGNKPDETYSPTSDISPENNMQTSKINLHSILSDVNTSEILKGVLQSKLCEEPLEVSSTFIQSSDTIKNINVIKDELCKLALNPCELNYINNSVNPLLNVLYQLSTTSYNLASTANLLTLSPIVHAKRHEIKETIDLTYKINEKCEDIYDELKKRLNVILDP